MFDLTTQDIKYLSGVGPRRAALFNQELDVYSLYGLLFYFPYKHIDRSKIYTIRELHGSMPYIQLKGRILSMSAIGEGYKKRLVAHFSDGTGVVDLVWFRGVKYIEKTYKLNKEYIVFGKPTVFGQRLNLAHPDIEEVSQEVISNLGLRPFYNTTEKMKKAGVTSRVIERMMGQVLEMLKEPLKETLPDYILKKERLMSLTEAVSNMHFPKNPLLFQKAEFRLKFEELLYVQLNILRYANERQKRYKGYIFSNVGEHFNKFFHQNLPFELTNAQKRVIKEIRRDMGSGVQMNRLLQGDVGSGKTLVALMSMLIALDNGYQACMMAPTEILAQQHYETIMEFLFGLDIRVELLTGSIPAKKRKEIHEGLLDGSIHILVGTHALIEDVVQFAALGFAVIDEQHRFGVAQRAKLWTKNNNPPHVLVMTATPIPRTLAMTLW